MSRIRAQEILFVRLLSIRRGEAHVISLILFFFASAKCCSPYVIEMDRKLLLDCRVRSKMPLSHVPEKLRRYDKVPFLKLSPRGCINALSVFC